MTRFALAFSTATVAVLGAASIAPAAVQLMGGDAGEGLTLVPANVVNATNFTGNTQTIQGVVFSPATPPTSVTAVRTGGGGGFLSGTVMDAGYGFGGTANDAALIQVANTISFGGGAQTFEVRGLTAGTTYKFDIIQSTSDAAARTQTLTFGGVSDAVSLATYGVYDSVFTLVAPTSGTIAGSIAPGTDGTVLNGLVVSTVPVPEPTSLAFLGLGGLTLLRRRR